MLLGKSTQPCSKLISCRAYLRLQQRNGTSRSPWMMICQMTFYRDLRPESNYSTSSTTFLSRPRCYVVCFPRGSEAAQVNLQDSSGKFPSTSLKVNRMIKSAPSAASILTKMQVDPACPSFVRSGRLWAPQTLVVQVAAPAADLSTWLIFKHLKQNLVPQKPFFDQFGGVCNQIANIHVT